MSSIAFKTNFSSAAIDHMKNGRKENLFTVPEGLDKSDTSQSSGGQSFTDHLKEGIQNVNDLHLKAEKMSTDVATGKSQNLHESMLALTESELSFNFMVQVRNKALEAYQEVMRMPV